MSFSNISCSCGGNNTNCFKCSGTGFVEVIQRVEAEQGVYLGALVSCPQCSAQVSQLATHLNAVHSRSVSSKSVKRKKGYRAQYCVGCGRIVKNLAEHIRKTGHGVRPGQIASVETTAPRGVAPLHKCNSCAATFPNATQLRSHTSGVHKRTSDLPARMVKPSMSSPPSVSTIADRQSRPEPNLDATKNWGQSFRDHGQFGSNPDFDAMDDESSP